MFLLCKIVGPKIRLCKIFDKFNVCFTMISLEYIREHVKTPLNGFHPLIVMGGLTPCSALKNKQKREKTLEISKIYLPFEKWPKTALKEWSDKSDRRFRFKAFLTVSLNLPPFAASPGSPSATPGSPQTPLVANPLLFSPPPPKVKAPKTKRQVYFHISHPGHTDFQNVFNMLQIYAKSAEIAQKVFNLLKTNLARF